MDNKSLIDEQKRVNKDLMLLYDVNRLLQTPLSTEEKLYITLTCLTSDDGFGYSRAHLFLTNRQKNTIEGWLGVGRLSGDDARAIWEGVAAMDDDDSEEGGGVSELLERQQFDLTIREFVAPIGVGKGYPVQSVMSKRPKVIKDIAASSGLIHPDFMEHLRPGGVAFVPLLSKKRVMGVIAVESDADDKGALDDGRIKTLSVFADLAGIALENAELYKALGEKVDSLERVNSELQEAQARVLHMDRVASMGVIAAGVAHEIKNPLQSLLINLHLLRGELPAGMGEVDELMDIIEAETVRLDDTMKEFLGYTKSPSLKLELAHPHDVLDQALRLVEYRGKGLGIEIVRQYDERVPATLLDERRLKQAFVNVLLNSIQAMPEGGRLTVRTGLHDKGDVVKNGGHFFIEFRDTGHGIPKGSMDRLLDPFYTTKEDGSGMGLPIVDSVVRSHGGGVNIENLPGKGANVTLCLPVRKGGG